MKIFEHLLKTTIWIAQGPKSGGPERIDPSYWRNREKADNCQISLLTTRFFFDVLAATAHMHDEDWRRWIWYVCVGQLLVFSYYYNYFDNKNKACKNLFKSTCTSGF